MPDVKDTPNARQRLLRAATSVFSAKGYAATRVSDIVEKAGVAQGTFYIYFKSKQSIFVTLVDEFFSELLQLTIGRYPATRVADASDLSDQISKIWHTVLSYCRARPDLAALVLQERAALPKDERERLAASYQRAADALTRYCVETARRGITRPLDPALAAWVVIGMLERAVHYAVFVAPQADLDAIVRNLVTFELSGLALAPPKNTAP